MDTTTSALIMAGFSVLGSIATSIFSYFQGKKKADTDAVTQLVNNALVLNKQELQTIRDINELLSKQVKDLQIENKNIEDDRDATRRELDELKKALGNCQDKVNRLTLGNGERVNE